ncbi:hypothetical protein FACS1894159_09100 [Bacteroidia bacterium]|nr:hypothetical protein FACS1894159_09100 [Bacteroidia bacterium]
MCLHAVAQVDYYANHDTVTGSNVIYKVKFEASWDAYDISNINNIYDDEPYRYQDGTLVEEADRFAAIPIGDHKQLYRQAVEETFTAAEITGLRSSNERVVIVDTFSTSSGDVMEVTFSFYRRPKLYSIPPDKWFTFEQKIKAYIKYTIPPLCQALTFMGSTTFLYFDKLYN